MKNKKINKILIITLTNIGDVVLTTPVIEVMSKEFSKASISIICSSKTSEFFKFDPRVEEIIIYNKHSSLFSKLFLALKLRKRKFDIVLDLRHTLFPILIGARYRSSVINRCVKDKDSIHKIDFHLRRIKELNLNIDTKSGYPRIYIPEIISKQVDNMLRIINFDNSNYIVISPGGKDNSKLWDKENFLELCKKLLKNFSHRIILTGDDRDCSITDWIVDRIDNERVVSVAGKTNLLQLAELLNRAEVLICNDSGSLHIGNAVKTPVVAIFGPTNELNYGPVGKNDRIVKTDINCRPCIYAKCEHNIICLEKIKVSEVYKEVKNILNNKNNKNR